MSHLSIINSALEAVAGGVVTKLITRVFVSPCDYNVLRGRRWNERNKRETRIDVTRRKVTRDLPLSGRVCIVMKVPARPGIETVVISPTTGGSSARFPSENENTSGDAAVRFVFPYICMTPIIKLVEIVHRFQFPPLRYIGLLHVKYRISKGSVFWYALIKNISLNNYILQITWATYDPLINYATAFAKCLRFFNKLISTI